MNWTRILPACLVVLSAGGTAAAQLLDEQDFPPGMLARYTAGGKTIERVDPDVAFVWDEAAPDPRLPGGPFTAEWSSLLLVRQEGTYRFHAYLQGEVTVKLDGRTVLTGGCAEPGWIRGEELPVSFGEQSLKVAFRRTQPQAQLRLFWTSDSFGLEPIPGYLLYREEPNPEFAQVEHGRQLYEAHRCNRCHRRENEPLSPVAPALTHLAAGTDREWIVAKILEPHETQGGSQMPSFGYTRDEAEDIAAWLLKHSQTPKLKSPSLPKKADEERRAGELLLRSLGCLACHTAGEHGSGGPYAGGDLTNVGRKRTAGWFDQWLREPAKLNADHRMPVFKLSDKERRQLVLYLASLGESAAREPRSKDFGDEQVARGRRLIDASRCAACHRIPNIEDAVSRLTNLPGERIDWDNSCLSKTPDRSTHRPAYQHADREAIVAYVESRRGPLSPPGRFEQGRRLLESRNCLACHERDRSKGIVPVAGAMAQLDPDLKGRSQALIPPALTAVGDKLRDDALDEAVHGKQPSRMPWLHVRMPQFTHSAEEQAAVLAYLVGHDRIPAGVETDGLEKRPAEESDSQLLVAGHTLIGAKGFSCIACHKVRDYEPKDVALGTRGSDLWMLGRRMRLEFYQRWVASPQRIVPGMEMPGYRRPVPGVLDEDVEAQLMATWSALNDPRFTAPTDPASVEQFLVVEPGEPARIIRDVFTLPVDKQTGYVPRAMAIGMNNGHSILFDLHTFSVRQWTVGDFARQRTQGKSWYWDMAGVSVMTIPDEASEFVLLKSRESRPIEPRVENRTSGRLVNYHPSGDGVEFTYGLNFQLDGRVHPVRIVQTIAPASPGGPGGAAWVRRLAVENIPDGYAPLLRLRIPAGALGDPSIHHGEVAVSAAAEKEIAFVPRSDGRHECTVEYHCSLRRDDAPLPPADEKPAPQPEPVTTLSGYDAVRLPLDRSIMPTAIAWTADGTLAFASLKGHIYLAHDTDGDGLEDKLTVFEEGLAAPYGLIADGEDLIVSHKPELLRLRDTDGDGRADLREVVATGWGYSDNYHDWTCGIVRDSKGNLYVGLGSDYSQPERQRETALWRGKVLRIAPGGTITPIAHGFRYPTGLAITPDDQLFASDNQGVQNTFNEINHVVEGRHYGVPSRFDEQPAAAATPPAIQVPHPWSRSVNGMFFLPGGDEGESGRRGEGEKNSEPRLSSLRVSPSPSLPLSPFAGHGIGCEYNYRFLVRFTLQEVGGEFQGAVYEFSQPDPDGEKQSFLGPLCGAVAPNGDIYIGSIYDSGWLGGRNTGDLVRLRPNGKLPNGIRELRATPEGFQIDFVRPVDAGQATDPQNYTISGYTRAWEGAYATPDSGRHQAKVESIRISRNAESVRLTVSGLREGHVYEVTCGEIGTGGESLWPATGHYTLHRIPGGGTEKAVGGRE